MAKRINPADLGDDTLTGEELPPAASPIDIVNLDDQIAVAVAPADAKAVTFWFGNGAQLFKFNDGTQLHVNRNPITIADPVMIANVKKLAEIKTNRIFEQ